MMFNYAAVCIIKFRVPVIRPRNPGPCRKRFGEEPQFGDTKFNCQNRRQLNIMSPNYSRFWNMRLEYSRMFSVIQL